MKLKELENYLSQCDSFANPKIQYEQYPTSSHIASRMVYAGQDHLNGSLVCDLGSGCGVLSIGSVLVGASFVVGFEIDSDAIQIAKENAEAILDEDSLNTIDFVQINLQAGRNSLDLFNNMFDVVMMNPPFGTKTNVGIDNEFLHIALALIKPDGCIYSLHKTSTRSFFTKKFSIPLPTIFPRSNDDNISNENNENTSEELIKVKAVVLAEVHFNVPNLYKFHKRKSVDILVDFWRFEKSSG